ncbi:hypothetical protein [Aestuariivirga sp.]
MHSHTVAEGLGEVKPILASAQRKRPDISPGLSEFDERNAY